MKILLPIIMALIFLSGCSNPSLHQASNSYKSKRDYASLEIIYKNMHKGMKRADVEHLLGEPDYSPTEGQYYYSSDRLEYPDKVNDGPKASVGIIVDYRDAKGNLTNVLQTFSLGPIGE
ncbi:MAG TPA: hypothetical protein VFG19_16430 [Geobacteraceae bacterium]|nr:hypothetical protein [Geobacteraceae bacterium]